MPTPRQLALADGAKTYFTGKACSRGHIADRRVTSKGCLTCEAERVASWRADPANLEKKRQSTRRWRAENVAYYRAANLQRFYDNHEAYLRKHREWLRLNPSS